MKSDRVLFTTGSDTGMQVVSTGDELSFHNHDDWCGDTISGFGAEVTIEIGMDDVRVLYEAMGKWIAERTP